MATEDLSWIETVQLAQRADAYLMVGEAEKLGRVVDELVRRALEVDTHPLKDEVVRYLSMLLGNPQLPEDVRIGLATSLAHAGLLSSGHGPTR